jgi:hypothetical protein
LPLGANLIPRGKVVPWEWILTLRGQVFLWGWNSLFSPPFFYVNSRDCSPLGVNEGVNIPPRDKLHPWWVGKPCC